MYSENYQIVNTNTQQDLCRKLEDVLGEQRAFQSGASTPASITDTGDFKDEELQELTTSVPKEPDNEDQLDTA
jgi:hypothetical protein